MGAAVTKKKIGAWILLALVIGIPLGIFFLDRDGRDMKKECYETCKPRFSRVVPDPKSISPNFGKPVPLVCECY
jgi:hypothetical protein